MSSVWSQFTGGFLSLLKHVWSPMKNTEAAASAIEDWAAKIAEWAFPLMGIYFAAAVAILVGSVHSDYPPSFEYVSLLLLLGLAFLMLAAFGKFKSHTTQILYCFGFFPMVGALFIVIAIPYQIHFKIITLIAFVVVIFVISCSHTIPST